MKIAEVSTAEQVARALGYRGPVKPSQTAKLSADVAAADLAESPEWVGERLLVLVPGMFCLLPPTAAVLIVTGEMVREGLVTVRCDGHHLRISKVVRESDRPVKAVKPYSEATDDERAQACVDAFKPLADLGKPSKPVTAGPTNDATTDALPLAILGPGGDFTTTIGPEVRVSIPSLDALAMVNRRQALLVSDLNAEQAGTLCPECKSPDVGPWENVLVDAGYSTERRARPHRQFRFCPHCDTRFERGASEDGIGRAVRD